MHDFTLFIVECPETGPHVTGQPGVPIVTRPGKRFLASAFST
jgi:hypothetical protein